MPTQQFVREGSDGRGIKHFNCKTRKMLILSSSSSIDRLVLVHWVSTDSVVVGPIR